MLDIRTLMAATMLANTLFAAVLLYFWRSERTCPGFLRITAYLVLEAVAYLLLALRGTVPDLVSIVGANILMVLAVVMLFDGLSRFYEGTRIAGAYYAAPFVVGFGAFLLRFGVDSPFGRVLLFGTAFSAFLLLAVRVLTRRHDDDALALFMAALLLLGVVVLLLRTAGWSLYPEIRSLFAPSPINEFFQLYQLIAAVLVPMVFLLATVQRLNRELRTSRTALRDLAGRYDLAIGAAGMGVWDYDPVARRLAWDERMYAIYGVRPDRGDDLFAALAELLPPDDRERVRTEVEHASRTGETMDTEFRLRAPDGGLKHIRARARTFMEGTDAGSRLVGVSFDVTAARTAEQGLLEAVRKLHLLSSITRHDIQNQVTALLGWLDLADEQAAGDGALPQTLASARRTVDRIAGQIAFTGEYQAIGVMSPSWQDLDRIVNRAIGEAHAADVVTATGLAGHEVYADPMLYRIFYNLIENALRHGGRMTRIAISARSEPDRLVVAIEDDGDGIPLSEKVRIFEPGVGKHTGFGLFMSREILGLTGFEIAETGEPGRGARFEIAVPRRAHRAGSESGPAGDREDAPL